MYLSKWTLQSNRKLKMSHGWLLTDFPRSHNILSLLTLDCVQVHNMSRRLQLSHSWNSEGLVLRFFWSIWVTKKICKKISEINQNKYNLTIRLTYKQFFTVFVFVWFSSPEKTWLGKQWVNYQIRAEQHLDTLKDIVENQKTVIESIQSPDDIPDVKMPDFEPFTVLCQVSYVQKTVMESIQFPDDISDVKTSNFELFIVLCHLGCFIFVTPNKTSLKCGKINKIQIFWCWNCWNRKL